MDIVRNGNKIEITGSVVRFEDYDMLKAATKEAVREKHNEIVLFFKDALSLNSASVGFLIKLIRVDGVKVSVKAGNPKLYELLDNLVLVDILNVSRA